MRLLLIILSIILFLPFLSSQNITINYPDEVLVGEEFAIKIKLIDFKEDVYDVKIDILNEKMIRVAKISNNEQWKSTYYYINDIIKNAEEKVFTLKILDYTGKSNIQIKIRNSSGSAKAFDNYDIFSKTSSKNTEKINESYKKEDIKKNTTEITNTIDNRTLKAENLINKELKPIKLTKDIKSENSKDKEDLNTTNYGIYGFVIFCVLLAILFVLKKFEKNE